MSGAETTAKLLISGWLEFKDDAGNIIKRVQCVGEVPLSGMTEDQAQAFVEEVKNGLDHCE